MIAPTEEIAIHTRVFARGLRYFRQLDGTTFPLRRCGRDGVVLRALFICIWSNHHRLKQK